MTVKELLKIVKSANTSNWNAEDVHNALEKTISYLENYDGNALSIAEVMCSCYICSKLVTDEEVVCNDCYNENQYQALQNMRGI